MARISIQDNLKKENLVVNTLYAHKGQENSISAKELCDILRENGFVIKDRSVNAMITKIKLERRIPICYTRRKGYFWAKTKQEIKATIRDIRLMISSLEEHAEMLQSFIIE